MDLTSINLAELAALAVAIAAIGTVFGAVIKWVTSADERVRNDLGRDVKALEKQIEHSANNNKMAFESVKNKLDQHNTEITRQTTEQRSFDKAIVEMRAEMREQSHNQTKLIDTRFDTLQGMIKEDREAHKDALKAMGDALTTSIREIRSVTVRQ